MTGAARWGLVLLVLALFGLGQWAVWSSSGEHRLGHAALVAASTLPLLAARRLPLAVSLVVVGALSAGYWLETDDAGQSWFAMLVAVYALGRHTTPARAAPGIVAVAASVLAIDVPRLQDGQPVEDVLPAWVVIVGVWGLGHWIRGRRAETRELEKRAALLERDREEATRAAVAYERARIARELHDLVAHSMAVTVVQAQAAQRVLDTDPALARAPMAAIERLSRQGLDELRRLLGMLDEKTEASPLDPPPSLALVDELVEQVRAAGLDVTLTVEGDLDSIPAGVDLSGYRIVQEGLTNALKHAGRGAHVDVGLTHRRDELEIVVVDDGPGTAASASGSERGLIGMRERVGLYGGSLQAGRGPEGGFEVRARLPLTRVPA